MKNEKNILEERIYREEYSIRKEIDNGIQKCFITFFGVVDDVEVEITNDDYKLYKSAFSKPLTKHENQVRRKLERKSFEKMTRDMTDIKEKGVLENLLIKSDLEEILEVVNTCTDIQKRRFEMYYFDNLTLDEIALIENSSDRAISKSIKCVLEKVNMHKAKGEN